MNRPADVTPQLLAEWEASRLDWVKREPIAGGLYTPEGYYSGCYIAMKLSQIGCPEELIGQICQAAGQRQATYNDFWGVALHVIEEYRQGRYELPGMELAEKLMKERFGENPDPAAIVAAMAERHADKGELFECLMTARYVMAYGPEQAQEQPNDQPGSD